MDRKAELEARKRELLEKIEAARRELAAIDRELNTYNPQPSDPRREFSKHGTRS